MGAPRATSRAIANNIAHRISSGLMAPSPMPRPVVITINDLGADPLSQRGALRAISPEEIRCAMLFAIAREVARGDPN